MNNVAYKKPTLEVFRDCLEKTGGNLTRVARMLKASRGTVAKWVREDESFKEALQDERSSLFDECLATSRIVATGIPAYRNEEYIDEKTGEVKVRRVMDGWIERPDGNMLRYLMGMLGKKEEGFKEEEDEGIPIPVNGITIKAWIKKENESEE